MFGARLPEGMTPQEFIVARHHKKDQPEWVLPACLIRFAEWVVAEDQRLAQEGHSCGDKECRMCKTCGCCLNHLGHQWQHNRYTDNQVALGPAEVTIERRTDGEAHEGTDPSEAD